MPPGGDWLTTRPLARSITQVASGAPGSACRASTSQFSPARRTPKRASGCDSSNVLPSGCPFAIATASCEETSARATTGNATSTSRAAARTAARLMRLAERPVLVPEERDRHDECDGEHLGGDLGDTEPHERLEQDESRR